MKKLLLACLSLCLAAALAAEGAAPVAPEPETDVSYSLGMILGASLKGTGLEVDLEKFFAGFKDTMEGRTPEYSEAQAQAAVQSALAALRAKKADDNLAAGRAFLAGNGKKPGVKTTASGLQYQVLTQGSGPKPKESDRVKVNYEGKLLDGTVFDSSIARNEPATFPLNGVIRGWTEGLQLMPVGSKYRFYVPSELAYGEQGAQDTIEPNTVLVFEVELLSIETVK